MCGPARLRSDQGSSIVHWNRVSRIVLGRVFKLRFHSRLRMGDILTGAMRRRRAIRL